MMANGDSIVIITGLVFGCVIGTWALGINGGIVGMAVGVVSMVSILWWDKKRSTW